MKYCIQHNTSTGYWNNVYDSFEEARKVFEAITGVKVPDDADLDAGVSANAYGDIIDLSYCGDNYEGESDEYCGIDMEEYRQSLI